MFPVSGGPFTVRIRSAANPYNPQISLSGGIVTDRKTLTTLGKFPAIYGVVQAISDADEFVAGLAVEEKATSTLDYDWQREGRSGRVGGWSLTFNNGIKLTGSS